MAAPRTAKYLVDSVRNILGVYGTEILRDGFSDDSVRERRIPILWSINRALGEYQETEYRPCRLFMSVQAGTREYTLPYDFSSVNDVAFAGKPLTQSSRAELLSRFPLMETDDALQGTPLYYAVDADVLTLYPVPGATDTGYPDASEDSSVAVWGYTYQPDLTDMSDVPSRLPVEAHEYLADIAAADIAGILAARNVEGFREALNVLVPNRDRAKKRLRTIAQSRINGFRTRMRVHRPYRSIGYIRG